MSLIGIIWVMLFSSVSLTVATSCSPAKLNCHYYVWRNFIHNNTWAVENVLSMSVPWNEARTLEKSGYCSLFEIRQPLISLRTQNIRLPKFGRRPWSELQPSGPPAMRLPLFHPAGKRLQSGLGSFSHLFHSLRQQTKGLKWKGLEPEGFSHRLAHFTSAMWLLDRSLEPSISKLPEVNCFIACY